MLNSRFCYSMKKYSFKGLNIDCIQYSNNILFVFVFGQIFVHEYYSYSYSLILEKTNIICIRIWSKF